MSAERTGRDPLRHDTATTTTLTTDGATRGQPGADGHGAPAQAQAQAQAMLDDDGILALPPGTRLPPELVLRNRHGLRVAISPLGATWTSCRLPLADGPREILTGSHDLPAMLAGGSYLGATVGRYAGRIAGARFGPHLLAANQAPHILHGGPGGFSRRLWQHLDADDTHRITLHLHSPDGDQGFPGNLLATACYQLDDDNGLTITYTARTDAPTPCNLTSHAYFDLDGGTRGDALDQWLQLHASHYQPVAADGIPDQPPRPVDDTGFDFRQGKPLRRDHLHDADQQRVGGYDHSFLLDNHGQPAPAAELRAADGRVRLRLSTDQPALHLYTGRYLAGTPGRDGQPLGAHAGIALESQHPPDSPSHGRGILHPGATYRHVIHLAFAWDENAWDED